MLYKQFSRFLLTDIFEVSYGNKLDLCALEETDNSDINGVAFVTRTASNNGIGSFVTKIEIPPYPENSMTVALGGSLGATFIQPRPFYTSQNVAVLCDKQKSLTLNQKLFIATLIKKEASIRYVAFGRELNKHIKKDFSILLPVTNDEQPDWAWIEQYMCGLSVHQPYTNNCTSNHSLDTDAWQWFEIAHIFNLKNGKVTQAGELPEGNDIWYLGAKKDSNGVMARVGKVKDLVSDGNCLVFICDGQGSVGYVNYMDENFLGTVNLTLGYSKYLNPYVGLFIATVASLERPRYSYGRKWRGKVSSTRIRLPSTPYGKPDWQFMENYIKSLPYGDCI